MKVLPSSNAVCLVPPPFVPVTYVAKAPISNSFPLKNDSGGGEGVMTCFDDTSGSPAKETTACDAKATTAKATTFFIVLVLIVDYWTAMGGHLQRSTRRGTNTRSRTLCGERLSISDRIFLLHLRAIDAASGGVKLSSDEGQLDSSLSTSGPTARVFPIWNMLVTRQSRLYVTHSML